ncbi:MAG: RusA family crossover junction endodeoxyribonuclease [Polynucleobacter sp.]
MMSPISDAIVKAIASPDYVLNVNMPLHSKARPRMTKSGHAYMAESYKRAQQQMKKELEKQWNRLSLDGPIALYLKIQGEARGDADNIAGFLMDAAGPSRSSPGLLWVDDRVSVISTLIVEWEHAKKADSRWTIQIALL